MNDKGMYALKPIKFNNISSFGNFKMVMVNTEHKYNLTSVLTQNILYLAYHEAKTIKDISELLNVPIYIIEDEISYLEENGFMDMVADDKFLTNILLHDLSKEVLEKSHKINTKYARIICEKYIPQLMEKGKLIMENGTPVNSERGGQHKCVPTKLQTTISLFIYVPENDFNFFIWSIISLFFSMNDLKKRNSLLSKHYIKSSDGSEYMFIATIDKSFELSYDKYKYTYFKPTIANLQNSLYPLSAWQCNTCYDDRKDDESVFIPINFMALYDFILGRTGVQEKLFDDLHEIGFLVPTTGGNSYANMVISTYTRDELLNLLPPIPDELIDLFDELMKELFELKKSQYPPHKQQLFIDLYRHFYPIAEIATRVLEILLDSGVLKPLSENQKKTVNMIMFCPELPNLNKK